MCAVRLRSSEGKDWNMPKQKTKKSVTKRFRRSAGGKMLRSKGGKGHLQTGKSRKRKRSLRRVTGTSPAFNKKLSLMLGPK